MDGQTPWGNERRLEGKNEIILTKEAKSRIIEGTNCKEIISLIEKT